MARTKGATNRQTLDVKELAQEFTAAAVERLASIMTSAKAPAAAQVAAARELLDRAHGKPRQALDVGNDGGKPFEQVIRWAQSDSEATPDPSKR